MNCSRAGTGDLAAAELDGAPKGTAAAAAGTLVGARAHPEAKNVLVTESALDVQQLIDRPLVVDVAARVSGQDRAVRVDEKVGR